MADAVTLEVNGATHAIGGDMDRPLLDVLREDLRLTATRFGCGEGLCGACHVIIDGRVVTACNTPLWSVSGKHITTLEGLGSADNPHPLQKVFVDEQAMQCGYCVSGIIMSAAALLKARPEATREEIRAALENNLCRCGAHNRMLRAIESAAHALRNEASHV